MLSYSTRKPGAWQGTLVGAGALLVLTLFFFRAQIFEGRVLYWGDIGLYFAPMQGFLKSELSRGRLPLWNPWILCGAPYVGNPQTWPLYPVSALLPVCSPAYFLILTVALHVWIAGVGTLLFLRRSLGVRTRAATFGATAFMFGGWLISKEQFPNMVQAAAWLPWVLWSVQALLTTPRPARNGLGLGVIVGLQVLAAHAQMTLLTLYLAAAYGLFLITQRRRWLTRREAGGVCLAGLTAFGLSAGQLLPTLQLIHDSPRQAMPFHVINRFYLPVNQLGNWVFPNRHGNPYFGDFSARGNFWETCCYLGIPPALFALYGAWAGLRRVGGAAPVRFWACVWVCGVLMALGGGSHDRPGPYWLACKILPGFQAFHDPARCLLWASFAASALAAWGLQTLRNRLRLPPVAVWAVIGIAFADLAHFGATLYPLADPARMRVRPPLVAAIRSDPMVQAGQARILAPDSGRVWSRFTGHRSYRQGVTDYFALWGDTLTPNLAMAYGLRDAYGYEPVARKDAMRRMGLTASRFRPNAPFEERGQAASDAGRLGVRYILTDRVDPPDRLYPGLIPKTSDPTLPLLREPNAPGRTYLSENAVWLPRAREDDTARPARIVTETPDRIEIETTAQRQFVLADTLAPGWTATLNGQPAPIRRIDGVLRGLDIPPQAAGQPNRAVFTYRPVLFRLGLYLTLLTWGALAGWLIARRTALPRAAR